MTGPERTRQRPSGREGSLRPARPTLRLAFSWQRLVACFSGCGDHDEPRGLTKQAVKFDEVPENVRKAAQKAIPAVKLNEAWKNLDPKGELHSYEIRGKNPADGKIREVRVSLTGEILEME